MFDTRKLLGKLEINGSRPHDYPCAEPVEYILKLDAGPEVSINDGLHKLLKHLQKADPPGVCV